MRPMIICLIVLGSIFAVCNHLSASGSTLMIINFAQQTNAPLRINSLTKTLTDAVSSVEVKNYSGKTIHSYQIGWIQTLPNGCAATSMKAAITNGPLEEVSIAPSATATTGSYRVWVKDLLATAKKHEAKLLYVQVGVMSVKFADGTTWNYGPSEEGLFDTAERNALSGRCTSGQELVPSISGSEVGTDGYGSSGPRKLDANLFKAAGVAIPDCTFFCEHVFAAIYCTNHGDACTVTTCPKPSSCARQECGLIC